MESKLTAISSDYGILHFNRKLDLDDDLAHAVYRYLIEYCYCVDDAQQEIREENTPVYDWDKDEENEGSG